MKKRKVNAKYVDELILTQCSQKCVSFLIRSRIFSVKKPNSSTLRDFEKDPTLTLKMCDQCSRLAELYQHYFPLH